MIKRNPQILLRSIAYWFAFNSTFLISAIILGYSLPTIMGVNYSISFAIGLLALDIAKNEEFNKDVFTNIGGLFIWIAVSQVAVWWLNPFLNNQELNSTINFYYGLSVPSLTAYVIIFLGLKYLLPQMNTFLLYLTTTLITGLIIGLNFSLILPVLSPILSSSATAPIIYVRIYTLAFIVILIYAIKVYIQDKPTGEYLHLLMIGFFFLILRNLIDHLSCIYFLKHPDENQYLVMVNQLFLATILLKKLNYSLSEFGKFYERQIYGVNKLHDIMLVRRGKGNLNFYLQIGKKLFYNPTRIAIILVGWVILNISMRWSFYITLNIMIHFASVILIFLLALHLYQRRLRKGNLV